MNLTVCEGAGVRLCNGMMVRTICTIVLADYSVSNVYPIFLPHQETQQQYSRLCDQFLIYELKEAKQTSVWEVQCP